MFSNQLIKVPRTLYTYTKGKLADAQEVSVEGEEEDNAWNDAIIEGGFIGGGHNRRVIMETVGGLTARVYRRIKPGKSSSQQSIFTGYDFLIDIDDTYVVRIENLVDFLDFSLTYLLQIQPSNDGLRNLDSIKDALLGIRSSLGNVDSTLDNIRDLLKPLANT